jgi:hypothetical protein
VPAFPDSKLISFVSPGFNSMLSLTDAGRFCKPKKIADESFSVLCNTACILVPVGTRISGAGMEGAFPFSQMPFSQRLRLRF